jgi:hypothetical protein
MKVGSSMLSARYFESMPEFGIYCLLMSLCLFLELSFSVYFPLFIFPFIL